MQILTMLELVIPLHLLFSIFGDGVRIMKKGVQQDTKEKPLKPQKLEPNDGPRHSLICNWILK